MKKVIVLLVAVGTLASCNQAKTAFVDSTQLMKDYSKNKAIEADFKTKNDKLQKEVDSIAGLLKKEFADFQAKAQKMSRKKAEKQYQTLMQKQQYFEQIFQQKKQQVVAEAQGKMDTLSQNVKVFIKDYGKKNGYTYIYNSGDGASVLYGDEKLDITKAVTKALNAEAGDKTDASEKKEETKKDTDKK